MRRGERLPDTAPRVQPAQNVTGIIISKCRQNQEPQQQ